MLTSAKGSETRLSLHHWQTQQIAHRHFRTGRQQCPLSLIGHGGQSRIFASAPFRPARVTLLSVVGIAARAEAATSIGRIGSGCLAFRRAMMRSRHLRLCPGSLVRTGRTATRAGFPVKRLHRQASTSSRRCRTWCHRSTWRGARRQVCGPRQPARVCVPSCGPAGHRSGVGMKFGPGH